jgi:hypothetical protein
LQEGADERMQLTAQSRAFRLKEGADKEWMVHQLDGADLIVFTARSHFEAAVLD